MVSFNKPFLGRQQRGFWTEQLKLKNKHVQINSPDLVVHVDSQNLSLELYNAFPTAWSNPWMGFIQIHVLAFIWNIFQIPGGSGLSAGDEESVSIRAVHFCPGL